MPFPVRAFVVLPSVMNSMPSGQKRRVTPSAESSPGSSLILMAPDDWDSVKLDQQGRISVTPYFAPEILFPDGMARVSQEFELPAHSGSPSASPGAHARHILLPFTRGNGGSSIVDDNDILKIVSNIFPGTSEISEGPFCSFISFSLSQMPQEPWPLTVCGIPITICANRDTSNPTGRGFLFPVRLRQFGNFSIHVCQHLSGGDDNLPDEDLRSVASGLVSYIRANNLQVRLTEVMYAADRSFYVILGNDTPAGVVRRHLPGRIANCMAGYILDRDLRRPNWAYRQGRRHIPPQPCLGIKDDTAYNTPRPGVMIQSAFRMTHAPSTELMTTSGGMVRNVSGQRFMIAASHAIGEDRSIFQALPEGQKRLVGDAVQEIRFTDIAIIQLQDNIPFVNELFEDSNGRQTRISRLLGQNEGDEVKLLEPVLLDSPFTGSMDGSVIMKSIKIEEPGGPCLPTEESLRYVLYTWVYTGQVEGSKMEYGPHIPADGTCGSAIVGGDGRVLGFFQYHIKEGALAGYSACVSAKEVVRAGFRMT